MCPIHNGLYAGQFLNFCENGRSLHQQANVLRFIGDATHDESSQGLEKLVLGVARTHFHNGTLQTTIIPIMCVAILQNKSNNSQTCSGRPCYLPPNAIRP